MQVSRLKQFVIVFLTFFALGASFKVMVLIEGLTEVRPVNAVPPIAGLAFGPIGALACGIGNLFADFFGSLRPSSVLGVIVNFIAAYLPYRLWHLFSDEAPNLHKHKNILLYVVICLVNALTTAWFLSFGIYTFFGSWIEAMYTYVFFNNFGFSVCLGMPLFIVLTSDSVQIECDKCRPYRVLDKFAVKIPVCASYFLLMAIIFVCVFIMHLSPQEAPWLQILSALSFAGLVVQLI